MLLDVLAKIVLQDVTFSTVAANVFVIALQRFSREPSVQEYLTSFFKLTMNVLLDYDRQSRDLERTQKNLNDSISKMQKGKTTKKGRDQMFVEQIADPEDVKIRYIKKNLIIDFLRKIVTQVGNPIVNNDLKNSLVKTGKLVQKKYRRKHRGIYSLLDLFGVPEHLVKEYKDDVSEFEDVEALSARSHEPKTRGRKLAKDTSKRDKSYLAVSDDETNMSVVSEKMERYGMNHNRMMYQPAEISIAPFKMKKKLTKYEEKALKDIEKIRRKR